MAPSSVMKLKNTFLKPTPVTPTSPFPNRVFPLHRNPKNTPKCGYVHLCSPTFTIKKVFPRHLPLPPAIKESAGERSSFLPSHSATLFHTQPTRSHPARLSTIRHSLAPLGRTLTRKNFPDKRPVPPGPNGIRSATYHSPLVTGFSLSISPVPREDSWRLTKPRASCQ
jgi:hypothetical protein